MKKERSLFDIRSSKDSEVLLKKLYAQDAEGTGEWEKHINGDVEDLFIKWDISSYEINRDAYTGLVLECKSQHYGDVVIKMYPQFLKRRFIKESYIMKTLSNYQQAPLLDLDADKQAMLLKRIIPGTYMEFEKDKPLIEKMFRSMCVSKTSVSDLKDIPKEIISVIDLTENEYKIAKNCNYHPELLLQLLKQARSIYDDVFAKEDKYLLHGDAYFKNVLHSNDSLFLIDPVAYTDAFIFEYMPMLTYELVLHSKEGGYKEKYEELLEFFSSFTDVRKFNESTFVFLVKQLIPSVYEANDGFKRADGYLKVIEELYLNGSLLRNGNDK